MAQRKSNIVRNVSSKRSKVNEKPTQLERKSPKKTTTGRTSALGVSGRKKKPGRAALD
jgi:hypothetical protein